MVPADVVLAGGGAYRRDTDGCWRYTLGAADLVPGAADVRLSETYAALLPAPSRDGGARVAVPLAWINIRPELGWLRGRQSGPLAGEGLLAVPWEEFTAADHVVGISAPELCAAALLDTTAVAAVLGITPRSVVRYSTAGRIVAPVAVLANSPVWSLPVLHRWRASRPTPVGGRPRGTGRPAPRPVRPDG